ncbi:MAG: hypothetical protein HONBIEJF_01942 [Fimbriimonadaceae bacterium]|nr:hypothetical protein [Fimbriimonadaceae bacterium]
MLLQPWRADWIGPGYDPQADLGVFAFRRHFELRNVPQSLPLRISADQRYRLYVNGQMVAFGPQRGDATHWFYDSLDIAPWLQKGDNWLAALVWNFGWFAPMAQHSVRTALVVEAAAAFEELSTPDLWHVARLNGRQFAMMHSRDPDYYIDVGPGEIWDARLPETGWQTGANQPLLEWTEPHVISHAEPRGSDGGGTPWMLCERTIPMMRYDPAECGAVERSPGIYDFGTLRCGYPRLTLSGPPGAEVTLTYAEAPVGAHRKKGHRDDLAEKSIEGYQDRIILGDSPVIFEPLWWRTFRYVDVQSTEPVRVESFELIETGYPLESKSTFECDQPSVDRIIEAGVRTSQLCAGETYFDCPYYEQLQYVGDTRIQALIGYYLSRDRALQRNSIDQFSWSILDTGFTQSRYPSRQVQVIPPFSLIWVLMLHDQVYHDRVPLQDALVLRAGHVIRAFERLFEPMEPEQYWNFCDWVPGWKSGVPPGGSSATVLRLFHVLARLAHIDLLAVQGHAVRERRSALKQEFLTMFMEQGGLISHVEDLEGTPSEHAEALYRIAGQWMGLPVDPWPAKRLQAENAARCTYYFDFYKLEAIQPDDYLAWMGPWEDMLDMGLTTFAENPEPTRSDCHAWSAHPVLGFFRHIAGIRSGSPGWRDVIVRPRPGSLRKFEARVEHLDGEIVVQYEDGRIKVESPVPVELVWKDHTAKLEPGLHKV